MPQFTKRAIMDTFIALLNKNALDKITVKDIVEACGINRNTFYYYFQDIYSLVDAVFMDEAEKVVNEETLYDSMEESLMNATRFAMDNKKLIYHLYNSITKEKVENYLYQISDKLVMGYVEKQSEGLKLTQDNKQFIADFYKFAFVGMTLNWISTGMDEDPSGIVPKITKCLECNVRATLESLADQ